MLFTTFNGVGGFGSVIQGYGFGETRMLTKGVDFNCNTSICYGIGAANHQLLKDLQTTINRYAPLGNLFAPLLVDGFIGDKSVQAANVAAATANITSPGSTREAVAANAASLIAQLTAFLVPVPGTQPGTRPAPTVAMTMPTQPGPPSQPTQPGAQPVLTPSRVSMLPAAAAAALTPLATTVSKVPLWVWITAGVTGVVVVGLVGYALRKPSPEAFGYDDYSYGKRWRRR
jgi:hypothetical protein